MDGIRFQEFEAGEGTESKSEMFQMRWKASSLALGSEAGQYLRIRPIPGGRRIMRWRRGQRGGRLSERLYQGSEQV